MSDVKSKLMHMRGSLTHRTERNRRTTRQSRGHSADVQFYMCTPLDSCASASGDLVQTRQDALGYSPIRVALPLERCSCGEENV